ncbi:MAG: glycosyltransferase family 2 protein [Saprospiraceae bacterium]|nr:glycosyltransferase family 2 protein [Saprospiraceae bacterium]
MLSILIPVYNYEISHLLKALYKQANETTVEIEFVVVDDASDIYFLEKNAWIKQLESVQYITASENMGRSKIRNYLASLATFDYLLFMDCDSMPVDEQYLQNYLQNLDPKVLLYGGRVYQAEPPKNTTDYFHWYYGRHREVQSAGVRQENPYDSFMSNNFLIPKAIFLQIQFEEELKQYGHEDTLFGLELKKQKVKIQHLDNPLIHVGLDPVEAFLAKTIKGVENLYQLEQKYDLGNRIKLLRAFRLLKQYRMLWFVQMIYTLLSKRIRHNLLGKNPKLRAFDLFKLYYLIKIHKQGLKS